MPRSPAESCAPNPRMRTSLCIADRLGSMTSWRPFSPKDSSVDRIAASPSVALKARPRSSLVKATSTPEMEAIKLLTKLRTIFVPIPSDLSSCPDARAALAFSRCSARVRSCSARVLTAVALSSRRACTISAVERVSSTCSTCTRTPSTAMLNCPVNRLCHGMRILIAPISLLSTRNPSNPRRANNPGFNLIFSKSKCPRQMPDRRADKSMPST
mmetsp:Transcript_19045/g.47728  ORF Transcript_19045/g.47728 Transcript_19045/m.47728 type:complete len:214 (-) Transcript_19045:9-650(-)